MISIQDAQQLHQTYKASPIYANNQLRFACGGRGETIGDYLKAFPLKMILNLRPIIMWRTYNFILISA